MLDLDSRAPQTALNKVKAIAGVMNVRELPQKQE